MYVVGEGKAANTRPLSHTSHPNKPLPPKLHSQLCRLLKHALRAGKAQFAPLLDSLLTFLAGCYAETRLSSFIYAASILVAEFGDARPPPRGMGAERAAQVSSVLGCVCRVGVVYASSRPFY